MDIINLEKIISETTDPATYQYFKGLKERRIIFNADVDEYIVENAMIPLMEMDNDGTGEPITIILNTYGRFTVGRHAVLRHY